MIGRARAAAREVPSVSWKIHREVALLLGWGSAILLQFAHPLVARGVADHSGFRHDARAPWQRLQRTLGAMLALTFGGEAGAARAAAGINHIHDRVQGRLSQAEGPYPAGASYSAHDPALLTWVHVACVDAFLRAYQLYVGPLTAAEQDRYCAEAAAVEPLLGIPGGSLPRSVADVGAYLCTMLAGGRIVVTDTARALARDLLSPPGMRAVWPVAWVYRVVTIGLLPPSIRAAYGLAWRGRHRVALASAAWLVRHTLPWLPPIVRHWPAARAAARRGSDRGRCYNPHALSD